MCPALIVFALWRHFRSKSKYDKWRHSAKTIKAGHLRRIPLDIGEN